MACHLPCLRSVRHVLVVVTLLTVASTPRFAVAQSSESAAAMTVRHALTAELGAVTQARWFPLAQDTRVDTAVPGQRWSTSGRVQSNVAVIATVELDGERPLSGWWLRDATGRLHPWDGRATAVSAPLGPGTADVEVQIVAPAGAVEDIPLVRLRVVAAPRR